MAPDDDTGADDAEGLRTIERTLLLPDLARQYRVKAKLGQGGMGAVFVAEQLALARPVALKFILGAKASDFARFRREGKLLSQLSHPNILKLLAVEVFGDTPVLVLELLEGRTLKADLAEKEKYPVARIREIGTWILDGLEAAHQIGIVHRDLKTENILLPAGGGLKILDFGLARESAERKVVSLTAAGTVVGTPAYMSPEQCQGHRVDARADLYSLGIILHELACGHVPFSGAYPMEILLKHLKDEPPLLSQLVSGIPAELEALVKRALAKKPEDRFASAAAFREALAMVPDFRLRASGRVARPSSRPSRSSVALPASAAARPVSAPWRALAVGAVLAGLVGAAWWASHRGRTGETVRPHPASPSGPSAANATQPVPQTAEVTMRSRDDRVEISGLGEFPARLTYHPPARPDLARTEAIATSTKDPRQMVLAWGPGRGEMRAELCWYSGAGGASRRDDVLAGSLPPDLRMLVDRVAVSDETDASSRRDMAHLKRERVFSTSPMLEGRLARLAAEEPALQGGIGRYQADLLDALALTAPERDARLAKQLERLASRTNEGLPVEHWARCVAALRLRELVPVLAQFLEVEVRKKDNHERVRILAEAMGSLADAATARRALAAALDRLGAAEQPYTRELVAALALLRDPDSARKLARLVAARRNLGKDQIDSEKTWLPLLALGEISTSVPEVAPVFESSWPTERTEFVRLIASARRGGRLATPGGRANSPAVASLDAAGGSEQSEDAAGRWAEAEERAFAGRAAAAEEQALVVALDRSLSLPADLPHRWNVDPASTALWCLGRQATAWSSATRARILRIARGTGAGSVSDAGGWVRQMRAVEAIGSQLVRGSPGDADYTTVLHETLQRSPSPVRWTSLCALARADAAMARALCMPGPDAEEHRVPAPGLWHATGKKFGRGTRLRLASWGAWRLARREFDWTDGDGYDPSVELRLLKAADLEELRPERFPRMGLEARVGRHVFRAGRLREIVVLDEGELLLRAWVPLAGEEQEYDGGPSLAWLVGLGPAGQSRATWAGLRGFLTVAVAAVAPSPK